MENRNSSHRPQMAPAPSNSSPPNFTQESGLSTYQSGLDLFSGVLSYAERSSPGVSSRINAADFVALSSGLLHASGLSAATRRVNICSPDVVSTVLTAAGSSYAAVLKKTTPKAKEGVRGKAAPPKGAAKSSNISRKSASAPKEKTTMGQKQAKAASPPLTDADKRRRQLIQACHRSLRRGNKSAPSKHLGDDVPGGPHNMRNNGSSSFTMDQVRDAVKKLSDEQISKRDKNTPLLTFIGLVNKDSIESQLAEGELVRRNQNRSSGASKSQKQKEAVKTADSEPSSTVQAVKAVTSKNESGESSSSKPTVQVAQATVTSKVSGKTPSKDVPKAPTAHPLSLGKKIAVRRVHPVFPSDDAKTIQERLVSAMNGLHIEREDGDPVLASGIEDSEDLFFHFMDYYRSKDIRSCCKMIDCVNKIPFLACVYKAVKMTLFFAVEKTTPNVYLVITNGGVNQGVSNAMEYLPDLRPSGSCANVVPYESPPRPATKMTERRTSDRSDQASTSSKHGPQRSSDPFEDVLKLSRSKDSSLNTTS